MRGDGSEVQRGRRGGQLHVVRTFLTDQDRELVVIRVHLLQITLDIRRGCRVVVVAEQEVGGVNVTENRGQVWKVCRGAVAEVKTGDRNRVPIETSKLSAKVRSYGRARRAGMRSDVWDVVTCKGSLESGALGPHARPTESRQETQMPTNRNCQVIPSSDTRCK